MAFTIISVLDSFPVTFPPIHCNRLLNCLPLLKTRLLVKCIFCAQQMRNIEIRSLNSPFRRAPVNDVAYKFHIASDHFTYTISRFEYAPDDGEKKTIPKSKHYTSVSAHIAMGRSEYVANPRSPSYSEFSAPGAVSVFFSMYFSLNWFVDTGLKRRALILMIFTRLFAGFFRCARAARSVNELWVFLLHNSSSSLSSMGPVAIAVSFIPLSMLVHGSKRREVQCNHRSHIWGEH